MNSTRPLHTSLCVALCLSMTLLSTGGLTVIVPSFAHAQDSPSLEELEAQAGEAYASEDYEKAIELLIQANQRSPHPNYLLNIAISYSKMDDCDNAVRWADRAVKSATKLPAESSQRAQNIIDECKGQANVTPPPEDTTPKPAKAPGWPPLVGYSLMGVGGLMLAGAFVQDLAIGDDVDTLKQLSKDGTRAEYDSLRSDIESSQTLNIALYSGAFVLLGTGVYFAFAHNALFESSPKKSAHNTQPFFSPWISPDGAGVQISSGF